MLDLMQAEMDLEGPECSTDRVWDSQATSRHLLITCRELFRACCLTPEETQQAADDFQSVLPCSTPRVTDLKQKLLEVT